MLLAAAILGVLTAIFQPLVTSLALVVGWVGVLVASVFAEALFFYAALSVTPGITVDGFWDAFWASWLFSFLISIVNWLVAAGDDTAFLTHLLRQSRHARAQATTTTVPGVVFLQIDGSAPLLRWALRSGNLPQSRWVRSGVTSRPSGRSSCPRPPQPAGSCTAPAPRSRPSGGTRRTPHASSWPTARKTRSSSRSDSRTEGPARRRRCQHLQHLHGRRPHRAAHHERRHGAVLAQGPSRGYATYFINSYGLSRSLVLSVEIIKERHQAGASVVVLSSRESTDTARTSCCARSRTCSCGTSMPD